jgi:hypothetical protein
MEGVDLYQPARVLWRSSSRGFSFLRDAINFVLAELADTRAPDRPYQLRLAALLSRFPDAGGKKQGREVA